MAIPKLYSETIPGVRGLKSDKDFKRFHYRLKIDGKEFTTSFDFSNRSWAKAERKKQAKRKADDFQKETQASFLNLFNPHTKMDVIASEYFDKKCVPSTWTTTRRQHYIHYIKPVIGKKKASAVIENDINTIRLQMQRSGKSKQNKDGNSYRSIQKILMQILKPMMQYALNNGAIDRLPLIEMPKGMKKPIKKRVRNGTLTLATLYKSIHNLYVDDPFYRALFLFALQGRRWNEIRTLEWDDIDLDQNFYTIAAEKNKLGMDQDYTLPAFIRQPLLEINDNRVGLVFKSLKTGGMISNPKRQLLRIREDSKVENLTMHYFRHILVTAMGEQGAEATVLSASLGHVRSDTVDSHYRTINHLTASKTANRQIEHIIDTTVLPDQDEYNSK